MFKWRRCPVCRTKVPWRRLWLPGTLAKGPCSKCGMTLGFDQSRRRLIAISAGIAVFVVSVGADNIWWRVAAVFVMILPVSLHDSIEAKVADPAVQAPTGTGASTQG